jgi:hypothetical protein
MGAETCPQFLTLKFIIMTENNKEPKILTFKSVNDALNYAIDINIKEDPAGIENSLMNGQRYMSKELGIIFLIDENKILGDWHINN